MCSIKSILSVTHCSSAHGAAHIHGFRKTLVLIRWDWRAHSLHERSLAGLGEHVRDHFWSFLLSLHLLLFDGLSLHLAHTPSPAGVV